MQPGILDGPGRMSTPDHGRPQVPATAELPATPGARHRGFQGITTDPAHGPRLTRSTPNGRPRASSPGLRRPAPARRSGQGRSGKAPAPGAGLPRLPRTDAPGREVFRFVSRSRVRTRAPDRSHLVQVGPLHPPERARPRPQRGADRHGPGLRGASYAMADVSALAFEDRIALLLERELTFPRRPPSRASPAGRETPTRGGRSKISSCQAA